MAHNKLLKEYEIDVVGKQNGIDIPVSHRLVIRKAMVLHNNADDGYDLWMEVLTYKDGTHSILLENDLFPGVKLVIDCGAKIPTSAIATLIKNKLEAWMNAEESIGSGNWTEIA